MNDSFALPDQPLVSIIIAAYNAENFIKETIHSILNQDYENIEIIVVDDGSTDNTNLILNNYKSELKYFKIENSGAAKSRNYAIKQAKGMLIAPFDADDIMLPNKISKQVDFLKNNPRVPIVVSDYLNFKNNELYKNSHFSTCNLLKKEFLKSPYNKKIILSPKKSCSILPKENFTITGSLLFHKKIIDTIGHYNTSLVIGEDFEFFYRIAKNYDIGVLNSVVFHRRIHHSNVMKGHFARVANLKIASRKAIVQYENDKKIKRKFKNSIAYDYFSLGKEYFSENKILSIKNLLLSIKTFLTPS